MRPGTFLVISLVMALAGLVCLPASAQQPGSTPARSRWSLGAAVLSAPRPYVGTDAEVFPIPVVQFESGGFYVQGLAAGYRFRMDERLTANVHLQPRFDGFDNGDSPSLDGMDEPDPTIDLGVGLGLRLGRLDLGLSFDADALGRSNGHQARISLARAWIAGGGRLIVRPELGTSWQSDDLIDYYYGVDPSEELVGRPVYRGRSGIAFDVGTLLRLRIAPRTSLIGRVQWTSLPDAIRDSPIVEDDATLFALVGVMFDL